MGGGWTRLNDMGLDRVQENVLDWGGGGNGCWEGRNKRWPGCHHSSADPRVVLESKWDTGTYALSNHSQGPGWRCPGAKRRNLILSNYWADQVVMF